ncbi:HNH endonuclease [Rhizobium leguminosarum]|uniref:HNH endonuclease n=1 Tax=Rhizobium leguminosarum TaxID=384 RepID=UPI001C98457C|nr:HNH endonuclease signature motif containing protein [Rhizobium leguminosarum]MBY5917750.1 HNH endonuclease [Rhizobium leguminosarum]
MARRSKAAKDGASQVLALKAMLDDFSIKLQSDDLREQVVALIPAFHALRDLGAGLNSEDLTKTAQDRILAYLRRYPFQLIDGDELSVVSGIGEWARRVRELRVEMGWSILTGVTIRELENDDPALMYSIAEALKIDPRKIKPDQYALMREDQDKEAAFRWNLLNGIRKKGGGVKAKLLEFFRANVGKPVTIEELRYLANKRSEWARRTRQLRTEDGWPIVTRMQGRPDLPIGSYVLEEDKQAAEHDRNIPDDVRLEVLERDRFACRKCRWTTADLRREDPRKFLELHHVIAHAVGGANNADNLITLCNVHHDRVHAGTLNLDEIGPPPP